MKVGTPSDIQRILTGTPVIVMLDIDGTLCDIVERPADAHISPGARATLAALARGSTSGVRLAFVTGRSVADARTMIGIDGVTVYGNHGMERMSPSGTITGPPGWEATGPRLRAAAAELARVTALFPGSAVEDKRFTLTVHHRGMNMALEPRLKEAVRDVAQRHALRIAKGKCVFNLTPIAATDKGDAVLEIINANATDPARAAILFVGDDVTDEDAFRALARLPHAVTVRVGPDDASSLARYSLASPAEVYELLSAIAEARL